MQWSQNPGAGAAVVAGALMAPVSDASRGGSPWRSVPVRRGSLIRINSDSARLTRDEYISSTSRWRRRGEADHGPQPGNDSRGSWPPLLTWRASKGNASRYFCRLRLKFVSRLLQSELNVQLKLTGEAKDFDEKNTGMWYFPAVCGA